MRERIGHKFWARGAYSKVRVFMMGIMLCLGSVLTHGIQAAEPAAEKALRIGLAPHTSARTLVASYQPLQFFLQEALQRRVDVLTAADFDEHVRRAWDGRYDLVITTGHVARLLQSDLGYLPLVTYQAAFSVVLVVKTDTAFNDARDLDGQQIVTLSRDSLATLWADRWLKEQGVLYVQRRYAASGDSIGSLVASGSAYAGVLSQASLDLLPPKVSENLRVVARSQALLGRVYMLHPRRMAERESLLAALEKFATTDAARAYFTQTQLLGYRSIQATELEAMEPYAQLLREHRRMTPAPKTPLLLDVDSKNPKDGSHEAR